MIRIVVERRMMKRKISWALERTDGESGDGRVNSKNALI